MDRPLEIFFSYAHEDEDLMNDVRRQLIVYERNGRILKWHDRMIPPGTEWRGQIDVRLETAQVILLFMSPHFIESRYCYEVEGEVALRRHTAGQARVIPIILRPCAWEETPFGNMQALPADAKPISRWTDRDEACLDAATGVMTAVDDLTAPRSASAAPVRTSSQAVTAAAKDRRGAAPWLRGLLIVLSFALTSLAVTATLVQFAWTPTILESARGNWLVVLGSLSATFAVIFALLVKAYRDLMKLLGLILVAVAGYLGAPAEPVPPLLVIPKPGWLFTLMIILLGGYAYFSYRLAVFRPNQRMQPAALTDRARRG